LDKFLAFKFLNSYRDFIKK